MDNTNKFIELRNHKRCKVKRGAVVAMIKSSPAKKKKAADIRTNVSYLASEHKNIKLGQIINISKGGIAFCYIDGEDEHHKLFNFDILFVQGRFYLKNMRASTVWISQVVGKSSLSLLERQQWGLQFEKMTQNQISLLDVFLKEYTTNG